MEIQYYYNRLENGPATRWPWIPCSKERAEKRYKAACETESFNNYVAIVRETKTNVTVYEAFESENWRSLIILTIRKENIFGGHDKTYRARFALSIFENAMDDCVAEMTAQ